MISQDISLIDIKPKRNAPSFPLINALANQVLANLGTCRETWWSTMGSVCLDNKHVIKSKSGRVSLAPQNTVGLTGKVMLKTGVYDPVKDEVNAMVSWKGSGVTSEKIEG